ncbi:FAD-binding protein [Microbacterium sp. STN6]|uniref:D-arabinono-1,4-lactone oxidase n=1 Tax=Microbacterium sp. STN6 TaxID=2995588 RepID=UPI0022608EF7|nr:D-arabinono-1,4-lactone oxidase [Microbacterium sp. STN6]MCX7522964.1 FAD-binding protein [Microbacterium sp. STN6]
MAGELNWAGNYTYRAATIERPDTRERLQEVVSGATHARALGTRHSFNALADSSDDGTLIALNAMPPRIEIDEAARTVTVGGGQRYGDVAIALAARGWALHNLASLPHISVAGAVATGTHGSGDGNGNLATAVTALELVRADGELVMLRRGDDDFAGAVVSLGALGVVTAVTLEIQPAFEIAQTVYLDLPWQSALEHFDEVTSLGYSVSLFTDWGADAVSQVWVKSRTGVAGSAAPASALFEAKAASESVHMLPTMSPVNCTAQLGVAGPWHERLPHFRLEFTPSNGEEIQSEYLVPRERAVEAIEALRGVAEQVRPVLQVTEIRTMAGDDLWLSEAYGRDTVGLHFTWVRDQAAVEAALVHVEAALEPFGARPHWGKVFLDRDGRVAGRYPRIGEFRALAERYDPRGVFRNAFLERHVVGG